MNRVHSLDHRVIIDFLSSLNCPRALSVAILLRNGEYRQIVELKFDPLQYNTLDDARWALQATDLLRKHEDLPTGIDRKSVALSGFFSAEEECGRTNQRLLTDRSQFAPALLRMVRKIADVLGEFDPEEFVDSCGWGPGSTLFIKRRDATPSNKFRNESELTRPLFYFIKPWFNTAYPRWLLNPRIVKGNKVITVPKNAKTERVIAVEPSLNLWFQKGIGSMIRRRLKRFGVDLDDQSVNQKLAQYGSASDALATVDFSAASDTIASQLVIELLPSRWVDVLCRLRSGFGYVNGDFIEYEKFSSMGNGFTFELESLIFFAATHGAVEDDHPEKAKCTVYGDDVIIPADRIQQFASLCDFLGFKVNDQKSFSSTPYRESCGKHYWNGHDITPIYNRRYLRGSEIMRFHNRVVELSRRSIGPGFRDKRFRSLLALLANASPVKERIPEGYGDIGLVSDFDTVCPRFCRRFQRGWYAKAYIPVAFLKEEDDDSFGLAKLFSLWKKGDVVGEVSLGNDASYPSRPRYRVKTLYFEDWPSLGPWV